ncbi:hypothetical protein [Aliivibrio fischeri]|uniref:hypothetical protein n=1 Tax=Aliivibrio fischeri TaxID=668 RepID=UPI00080DE5C4|nr:hypothetical protein [Aliivibrio fischeri]OCH36615.1 hypothetical protein A6D99_15560 [Aliivibrio fischeri]
MKNAEFLDYLDTQFKEYRNSPSAGSKKEQKAFINGLMKAARIFGVTFDELEQVVKSNLSEDYLDIPTFIRKNMELTE